jgi:hypothetical protein
MHRIWFQTEAYIVCNCDCPTIEVAQQVWDVLSGGKGIFMISARP